MQKDSEPIVATVEQHNLLTRLAVLNIESIVEIDIHPQVQRLLALVLTQRETKQLVTSIQRMLASVRQALSTASALSIADDEEIFATLLEEFEDSLELEISVERAGIEDVELPERQMVIEELLGYQDALDAFMSEALEVLRDVSIELLRAISDLDEVAMVNVEHILQKPYYSFVTLWTKHLAPQLDMIH